MAFTTRGSWWTQRLLRLVVRIGRVMAYSVTAMHPSLSRTSGPPNTMSRSSCTIGTTLRGRAFVDGSFAPIREGGAMAKQRVIAYFMHESERNAAEQVMTSAQVTDSFAIGEMDDAQVTELRKQGIIVNVEPSFVTPEEPPPPPSPGTAAFGFGLTASAQKAFDDAVPQPIDFYTVQLAGPLMEPWRQQLEEAGVRLLERQRTGGYKARLTAQQVATLNGLSFVESVKWIAPKQSAPTQVTQSVSLAPGAQPAAGLQMLTFDVRLHLPEDNPKIVQWLRDHNISIAGASGRKIRFFALENSQVLSDLALLPEVDVIAEYVKPVLYNDAARRIIRVDSGQGNPSVCVQQDGNAQIVAVADTGIDDTHPDFAGRIVAKVARGRANDPSDPAVHSSHLGISYAVFC